MRVRRAAIWLLVALGTMLGRCPAFEPRPGDLLFLDADAGPLADAIEKVTQGVDGAKFCHVGIVVLAADGRPEVIEAVGKGVKRTPLSDFLARSHDADGQPRVVVGRLKPAWQDRLEPALQAVIARLGRAYNDAFVLGNDRYYCSQLVWDCYRDPATGESLFELAPMTYKEPGSDEFQPVWRDYFAARHQPIPEGQPGCNPGGLSRSEKVTIVYAYGCPKGWTPEHVKAVNGAPPAEP